MFVLPRRLLELGSQGMMLGNATSGVAVALSTVLSGLTDGREAIEARLALGASRWEATHELLAASLRTGLTPVLNQMSIIGLVSIPGALAQRVFHPVMWTLHPRPAPSARHHRSARGCAPARKRWIPKLLSSLGFARPHPAEFEVNRLTCPQA